ncbi:hypothetical protein ACFYYS_15250 [Streptomyces sp. NPDC002120]|uniref:hypothetical protein n=1 Tax=Streptomyces sp. NPDC002120 TaxID=3364631 RepID=UPI003687CFEF
MAPTTRTPATAPGALPACAAEPHGAVRADRTRASVTARRADGTAGPSGAPVTHPACAAAPRRRPAGRPGRDGARATTATAGASLPAGSGRARRAAARAAVPSAQNRPAGPEGRRTTGEGA